MKFKILSLSLLSMLFLSHCGGGASDAAFETQINSGKKLATKNGVTIHQGYLDYIASFEPKIKERLDDPKNKKNLVDGLLTQEILYRESVKRGITDMPKYQNRVTLNNRRTFIQALMMEEVEKQAKAEYEKNKDSTYNKIHIAHILVRPKRPAPGAKDGSDNDNLEAKALEKAKEAKQKLDSGTQWEDVVKEYSDDVRSKDKGGDFGLIGKQDRRVKPLQMEELVNKAFSMKVGEVSEPIKTRQGYHIIKVLEAPKVASFEEVEDEIKMTLRGEVQKELMTSLIDSKETVYEDEELKKLGGGDAASEKAEKKSPIQLKVNSDEASSKAKSAPKLEIKHEEKKE
ncbi:MAG: peptidylprolyl isomerase [Deltaproteobacteria bacterium]|nr:peptidylprolyl isomerase [Deltaproteobacteria bacterium]